MVRVNRLLAAVLGILAGCAPALAAAGPAHAASSGQVTMVVATLQDVDTLNPFLGASAMSTQVFRLTYDYLTDHSPVDNRPVPGLASRWQTSADGLTWTFQLRDGVTWSDGKPLTAADVGFTYRTLMTHPTLANAALVHNFADVSAPDPHTLVIRTTVPTPGLLDLDIPIVPEHLWAGHDPGTDLRGAPALVGSGPFRLVQASQAAQYRFERNPGYWRGPPKIDGLIFRYFTNSDVAVQALRKGEVDVVTNLTPVQYDALAGDPRIARNESRDSRFTELGFNPGAARKDGVPIGNGHPALKDVRVRQAVEYAIDRSALVDRVLRGHGEVGGGYLPPTFTPWGWRPDQASARRFDLAAANRILDAAGYRRGADGVRLMPGGTRRLSFNLLVPNGRAHYQESARYLTDWLAAIGIEVHPQLLSDSEKFARTSVGRYDMFLGGWILDPDPDFLMSVQTCGARPDRKGAGTTDTFVCNPDYDALYQLQSQQIDRTARAATIARMQAILYRDADLLTLYYPAVLEAYRADRFTGLVRRPAATGSVAGPWSYAVAAPVSASRSDDGPPVVPLLIGGLLVLVVGAAAFGWARSTRDRRE
jgi:peptide/nickel transport system substrate-binding protein